VFLFNHRLGGCNIPGEDDSDDFGTGAGFYVDATQEPWKENYRMFSYITKELPEIINSNFPVSKERQSIMGHRYVVGFGSVFCPIFVYWTISD
jgi:S-formylglutathione hydrolase